MRHSHLSLALSFFCGFQAQAQTAPTVAESPAPGAVSAPTVKEEESTASAEEEKPLVRSKDSLRVIPFNLGIAPGASSNGDHPEAVLNHVSLDLVAGEAGAIRGVQLAGGMNELHGPMVGVQASAGLNKTTGNVSGVQASTVNLVKGDIKGVQYGYVLNRVEGNVTGWQGSSFGTLLKGDIKGVQASSLYGDARTVKGLQLNGICVADTLYGMQWGAVNYAKRSKGVQFGLVNVSRGGNTAQIGLVNVHPNTRIFAESWVDETRSLHVAMNYGGPNFYNLVEVMGNNESSETVGFGLGFGARASGTRTILSLDQSALVLMSRNNSDDACKDDGTLDECRANFLMRTRLTVGRHATSRLAFFGGVSYNVLLVPEETSQERLLEPERAYHWDPTSRVRLWPGVFVGVRI